MSRGFYVEGLIFGILRYVATDIKMLRSKFLAKMVSAKFAYQNTGPVCHILLLSIYIFATYLQGVNLCKSIFSIQEKFKCLYLESLCSAFKQVAQTFSKSCLKVALALVNLLPSFLHI